MPPPITAGSQLLARATDATLQVLQVDASPEVRTLHVWTDRAWYVASPLTPSGVPEWRCMMTTEVSGGIAGGVVRTRVLQPRGESLLVPANTAVTVSVRLYPNINPAVWSFPTDKVYATVSPGIPQQREVWGGSWGGAALTTTVTFNANEFGGDLVADPFQSGARFATSLRLTVTGPFTIDYGGSSWAQAAGTYWFSPDLKIRVTVPSNTIVTGTWGVFE